MVDIQDYRCPRDAFCIWQGLASAALVVTDHNSQDVVESELFVGTFGQETANSLTVDGVEISLANVLPEPTLEPSEAIKTAILSIKFPKVDCRSAVPQFCTLQYDPVTCDYYGQEIFGSNSCFASLNAQNVACSADQPFVPSALKCTRNGFGL